MQSAQEKARQRAVQMLHDGLELPPIPEVSRQLLAYSQQPDHQVDIGNLSKLIESDPALTTRLLQVANASYYGSFNRITQVRQAIMRIGVPETISSLNWLICQKLLPRFPRIDGFTSKNYWAHAWVCGTANRMLGEADETCTTLSGELYLAGLLHGIGQLVLAVGTPHEFRQCLQMWQQETMELAEAELEILGTTDCHIGFELLKIWNLPESVAHGVRYYRNPDQCPPEFQEAASLTQFAYIIANQSAIGTFTDPFCPDMNDAFLVQSGNSLLTDPAFRQNITAEIHKTFQQKAGFLTGVSVKIQPEPLTETRDHHPGHAGEDPDTTPAAPPRQSTLSRILTSLKKLLS